MYSSQLYFIPKSIGNAFIKKLFFVAKRKPNLLSFQCSWIKGELGMKSRNLYAKRLFISIPAYSNNRRQTLTRKTQKNCNSATQEKLILKYIYLTMRANNYIDAKLQHKNTHSLFKHWNTQKRQEQHKHNYTPLASIVSLVLI